jgi:hypothetical protein
MPLRPLLLFLFACITSADIAAQTVSDAAVSRIDHFLIEQRNADESFQLFATQFKIPVIWPMAHYGPFSSGGLYFGNVVVEFGQFAALAGSAPENPRLAGIAFQPPHSAAASIAELEQLRIAHGPAEPFTTYRDGKMQTLWTNVRIIGIAPADTWLFVCEYHIDTKSGQAAAGNELKKVEGGPLGLLRVKEILVETANLQATGARWKALLSSANQQEAGVFAMSGGPAVQLVLGKREALRLLTLEVSSLSQAKAALTERNVTYDDRGREVLFGNATTHGLPFRLVQPD